MGAGSQYQKASPPHESNAAFIRVETRWRRFQITAAPTMWMSCSQPSQPRKTGTVMGAKPEMDASV